MYDIYMPLHFYFYIQIIHAIYFRTGWGFDISIKIRKRRQLIVV